MLAPGSLRLIAITDNLRDGVAGLVTRAQAVVRGGVTMIHVRLPDESPRTMVQVTQALVRGVSVPVLVHDRADVALAGGAGGVHLSDREPSPAVMRRILPDTMVIGASVGDAGDVARVAAADYLAAGPVFATRPGDRAVLGAGGFAAIVRDARCPVVAIGGITSATLPEALQAGAAGVAVLSALFASADPEGAARRLAAGARTST